MCESRGLFKNDSVVAVEANFMSCRCGFYSLTEKKGYDYELGMSFFWTTFLVNGETYVGRINVNNIK